MVRRGTYLRKDAPAPRALDGRYFTTFALFLVLAFHLAAMPVPQARADDLGLDAADVKLLADFSGQTLASRGEPISWQQLVLGGSATIIPGQGLVLEKGGVNEIVDPSFEGEGWQLFSGATIAPGSARRGEKALAAQGDGSTRLLAQLKEPIAFIDDGCEADQSVVGRTRTLSFSYAFSEYQGGSLQVVLKALDQNRSPIGSSGIELTKKGEGWQDEGVIYDFPAGTAYYQVEIRSVGLVGSVLLDAFKSEHKDYFTPYFDGDSGNSLWVSAAPPENLFVEPPPSTKKMMAKAALPAGGVAFLAAGAFLAIAYRFKRNRLWWLAVPVAAFSLTATIAWVTVPRALPVCPVWPSASGSQLEANEVYFYRISAVDANGWESPPSSEIRAQTGRFARQLNICWMRDPGAVKYRLYRGTESYRQDEVVEVDAQQSCLVDTGEGFTPAIPPEGLPGASGPAHASRSLRPAPDARIDPQQIGFDATTDFWLAGELVFGFDSSRPFRPASLFEVGNARMDTILAVSFRFVPGWGDERAKILLIRRGASQAMADNVPVEIPPIAPGSKVRYVVAQVYHEQAGISAGAHLWYSLDGRPADHLFIPNSESLERNPYLVISKRNFFDYFANNSTARALVLVQGTFNESLVGPLMHTSQLTDFVRGEFSLP